MATIRDVAQKAGVSTMTVSRVLNKSGYVSQPVRARVEAAVAELGYIPNTLGLSLRFKQTRTLALVLTDITNPFWTTVARGVEDAANDAGFTVILCNTDESETKQARYLNILLQKRVDGVLLVPACSAPEAVAWLRKREVPFVIIDRKVGAEPVDTVRCDSREGGYRLTRLLLDLGHRHIAMLAGPRQVSTAADRAAGYEAALREAGLEPEPALIVHGAYAIASGYAMMQQVLRGEPRPTAVFAANNFLALGAYRALRAAGLRVPEDIAMVAYDDLPEAMTFEPFLTAAAQPAYDMGKRATQLLLARLAELSAGQAAPRPPEEIVLPTDIIVRRSSGPPLA
ncbi:MAG: Ribose operon repressor [Chloroflexi bacterium ADurb.Bin325]|nr:MAG: Ribose operon repressor [Chloroflexi bacterium ADurb.Bin325]